jgi:uncharacterized protein (UPF0548 family)
VISLARPTPETIERFLEGQRDLPFTYPEPGVSRDGGAPPGFDVDRRQRAVGRGRQAFAAGCAALRAWEMGRHGWAEIQGVPPVVAGTEVAMVVRFLGLWWVNACRIVYVIDEPRRFGLAYGTLPGHVECGEERFSVEWREDDSVWYDLTAFSRPRHPLVRLGYPLARRLQKRFALQSLAAMERAVRQRTGP